MRGVRPCGVGGGVGVRREGEGHKARLTSLWLCAMSPCRGRAPTCDSPSARDEASFLVSVNTITRPPLQRTQGTDTDLPFSSKEAEHA